MCFAFGRLDRCLLFKRAVHERLDRLAKLNHRHLLRKGDYGKFVLRREPVLSTRAAQPFVFADGGRNTVDLPSANGEAQSEAAPLRASIDLANRFR